MSAANGGVDQCKISCISTRRQKFFDGDGLIPFVLSGSSVEPDNTNGSKSNHQHKEASGVRLEMRNLTYD